MTWEENDNWRDLDVTADDDLAAIEKETNINIPNDLDMAHIHSDIPTFIKWVQSVEEAADVQVRINGSGEIIGVMANIPKGIIKLQGNSRKSNAHSQMVTYGPLRE
jgi:hypothetical protein